MNCKKAYLILTAAVFLAASSCKKDEKDEALPYLSGSVKIEGIDEFIKYRPDPEKPDEPFKYTLKVSGVSHPEGKGIGYKWKVSPVEDDYTTTKEENGEGDGSYRWGYKDTLATFTVYCQAFASGYSGQSGSVKTTMVKYGKDGSIRNAGYPDDYKGTPSSGKANYIEYDGIKYFVTSDTDGNSTSPDGKIWMRQNLAFDGPGDRKQEETKPVGAAFKEAEAMSDIFGRFYTWEEATGGQAYDGSTPVRGICPEGWHIPSDAEWTALANATLKKAYPDRTEEFGNGENWSGKDLKISRDFMAGTRIEGSYGQEAESATFNIDNKLWAYSTKVGDPLNRSEISALPVGYAEISGQAYSFRGVYEYAVFWTSDRNNSKGVCRTLFKDSPDVIYDAHDPKSFAASVRCIKD